jgi:hypothetical protein
MLITRAALPRRTFLRGLGAAIALPLLDGMVPAMAAQANTAARADARLAVVYLPNGIVMSEWTPAKEGTALDLSPTLAPLAAFRDRLIVLTGLRNGPPHFAVHGAASTRFLTTVAPEPSTGSVVGAGISMDQLAAAEFGRQTPLGSLELTLESGYAGACDIGSSCVYTDTISWRGPTTPLPMEHNPRAAFERLFGEQDTTDAASRLARNADERSILDSVAEAANDLQRTLGGPDRAKVSEYLDAVRDVERRIQNLEKRSSREVPGIDRPTGIPAAFPDHCRLMFDLQVLAHQADLTRVTTFMMGRELSGRSFPEIDIHDAHHPTSHHQHDPEKIAKLVRINAHFTKQFASFLDRLRSTPDGDGSLFDHLTILYGAGMSDGDSHSPDNLPVLVTGGGAGRLRGGRHLRVPGDTVIGNLHMTLLEQLGIRVDHFGNSTGRIDI